MRFIHWTWRGVLGVGLVLTLGGAAGCSRRGNHVQEDAAKADSLGAWSVEIGAEGGFTGGGSGHLVLSDGTVSEWSQITPGDSNTREPAGRATPEALVALHQALVAPELVGLRFEERGNMTAYLAWRRDGGEHRWSWPERPHPDIPAPLQRAYDAARAAVLSARP